MAVRPVVLYGDPVLRRRTDDVEGVTPELAELLDDMVETMYAEPGIGLAAPQVGVSMRALVIDLSAGEDAGGLMKLLNPRLVFEEDKQEGEEGCLSFPGIFFSVSRPLRVRVEAKNEKWKDVSLEAEELLARALCHEIDHLEGRLFIDHLGALQRGRVKRLIRRLKRSGEWGKTMGKTGSSDVL